MQSITVIEFFQLISIIASYILPLVGILVLLYVIRLLKRLSILLETSNKRVEELEKTIQLVDDNLESISITTESVANMSVKVDNAVEKSAETLKDLSHKVSDSIVNLQHKGQDIKKDLSHKISNVAQSMQDTVTKLFDKKSKQDVDLNQEFEEVKETEFNINKGE